MGRAPRTKDWILNVFYGLVLALGIVAMVVSLVNTTIAKDNSQAAINLSRQNGVLLHRLTVTGDRHHNETEQLLEQIHALQDDHSDDVATTLALAKQVNAVVSNLPAADQEIATLAVSLVDQLNAVCDRTGADCPPIPAIPGVNAPAKS